MQNVSGAASEAVSTYNGYVNNGTLANSKVFYIPVYDNMPATPCYKPSGFSDTEPNLYTVNADSLRVRSTPSTSGAVVTTITNGTTVKMLQNNVATANGYVWARIQLASGTTGYVANEFLTARGIPAPVSVNSVSLSKTSLSLDTKTTKTSTLSATILPSNAANQNISWTTNNSSVATVSNGVVTAVGPGTCTITVITEDGNKTATCTVSVTVPAESITLDKTTHTMEKAETLQLNTAITPSNCNQTTTWTSSDTNVATVTNGTVTAVGGGTATITAKIGDKTTSCVVTVNSKVTNVKFDQAKKYAVLGKEVTLTPTIEPSDATNKNVTWQSSNENIVKIDSTGKITPVAKGKATITVTTVDGGKTATCEIEIIDVSVEVDTTLKNENNVLSGFKLGQTIKEVKEQSIKVTQGTEAVEYTVTDVNGNNVTDDKPIGTGMKIQIKNNGQILYEYTAVMHGDTNGDGKTTSSDYVLIKNHIMGEQVLGNIALKGADYNQDGKATTTDYVLIKNYIMSL